MRRKQHAHGRVEVSFYPDDLFPRLRRALATLADIEIRWETEGYPEVQAITVGAYRLIKVPSE